MRYWLHKMGLTRTLAPLPYSECLVRRSALETLAPVVYKNAKTLKSAVKARVARVPRVPYSLTLPADLATTCRISTR
jgi:hypothetical protein